MSFVYPEEINFDDHKYVLVPDSNKPNPTVLIVDGSPYIGPVFIQGAGENTLLIIDVKKLAVAGSSEPERYYRAFKILAPNIAAMLSGSTNQPRHCAVPANMQSIFNSNLHMLLVGAVLYERQVIPDNMGQRWINSVLGIVMEDTQHTSPSVDITAEVLQQATTQRIKVEPAVVTPTIDEDTSIL